MKTTKDLEDCLPSLSLRNSTDNFRSDLIHLIGPAELATQKTPVQCGYFDSLLRLPGRCRGKFLSQKMYTLNRIDTLPAGPPPGCSVELVLQPLYMIVLQHIHYRW